MVGSLAEIRARRASPVRSRNGGQPSWAQIVAGRKTWLPKAWSKWPCVLTTTRHRVGREHPEVVEDLPCLDVGGPRIDHERRAVAQHDADVLVVELVPAHEDAIAELDPGGHDRHGTGRAGGRAHRGRVGSSHAVDRQPRDGRGRD